jgi:hypothetical protein
MPSALTRPLHTDTPVRDGPARNRNRDGDGDGDGGAFPVRRGAVPDQFGDRRRRPLEVSSACGTVSAALARRKDHLLRRLTSRSTVLV